MFNLDNLKIWVCNHKTDANLSVFNDSLYQIYNVYDNHSEKNIDNYNKFISEYVLQYYVSQNNLYSEIVGFCQYSRPIYKYEIYNMSSDPDKFIWHKFAQQKNNRWYVNNHKTFPYIKRQVSEWGGKNMLYEDIVEYLTSQNIVNHNYIKNYTSLYEVPMITCELYVIDWNGFIKLTEFIDGYLEFIYNKYNITDFESFQKHVYENHIRYYQNMYHLFCSNLWKSCYQPNERFKTIFDEDEYGLGINNCWRQYAYCIELLISVYLAIYRKYECNNNELW